MRVANGLMMGVLALALGGGAVAAENKIDSGMSTERLRRVGVKIREYVDGDRLAGAVDEGGHLQLNKGNDAFTAPKSPVFPSGAGGLVSTADDYLRFARMLLAKGQADGVRLLSPKAVEIMTTDYLTKDDRQRARFGDVFDHQGFGYGLAIVTDGGVIGPSAGAFHWDGASGCSWIADPREDMITIVLMQQYNYWEHSKVLRDARAMAYSAIEN